MNRTIWLFCLFLATMTLTDASGQLTVRFPAKDGLPVTAEWYPVSEDLPVVLLCHQNRFSRGEYAETALKLNKFGFNCLAIDQRVGDEVNGIRNQTADSAAKAGLKPTFDDAAQDVQAAIDYLFDKYHKQIIVLGSSYSATLALTLSNNNPKVLAVIAFSPGEYFSDPNFLKKGMKGFAKPLLVISSRAESESVKTLTEINGSVLRVQYIPSDAGDHGSKVLWSSFPTNQEYWVVMMNFLNKLRFLD